MFTFLLIVRHFYVRNGILQQMGDEFRSFAREDSAQNMMDSLIASEISISGAEKGEDELGRVVLSRPNGSKVVFEIQTSLVRE